MSLKNKKIKIILTGGGTGGSVTPLLAIVDEIKNKDTKCPIGHLVSNNFLWLGTKSGVEKTIVEKEGIRFKAIISGKWRRYFSFANFIKVSSSFTNAS